jgi:hypothetical protein
MEKKTMVLLDKRGDEDTVVILGKNKSYKSLLF